MEQTLTAPPRGRHRWIVCALALALVGCNEYSTPVVQSSTANAAAQPSAAGVNNRSANPLNNQAAPSETTGSVGGSPAGTASAQTAPSSSNGVR